MPRETKEKLARSLTAETTDLLPYLPYLLQDLWELGANPTEIIRLIKKHMPLSNDMKILDLACGKGAVSIKIAESLGIHVHGIDIIPEFIEYANQKAKELNAGALCHFACGDVNEVVNTATNYDCVIFGATGDILGNPPETLRKLTKTIRPGGYVVMDECYLPDGSSNEEVRYKNYDYLTHEQWLHIFKDSGLTLVEETVAEENSFDYSNDMQAITLRANELIVKHPEKRMIFEGYIQSQLNECDDLKNSVVGVTWMLQKTG